MDPRVSEFHCIMPMANVSSVMARGILSNEGATKLDHQSVALQLVQDKRRKKRVPGGLRLHQYANLYFHARNPMLFKLKDEASNLCILKVSTDVLNLDGSMLSDRNAASDYVRFLGLEHWTLLDYDAIYAMDWRHPGNPTAFWRHRSQKCAEALIPQRVEPRFVTGAYVVDDTARARLVALGFTLPITINPVLFFQ